MALAKRLDQPEMPVRAQTSSGERVLYSSSEMVYVAGLTHDVPTFHLLPLEPPHADRPFWQRTECGQQISWTMKNTIMPMMHAECFADPCTSCGLPSR